ncbi:MAG: DUF4388 domain-containing protein [Chloroflexi bacterium]|nr:DUF4388 domain-containing protein [Chloroflexota bacterium]
MDRRPSGPLVDTTPPDLVGQLGAFTLSDILQMLGFSGKTGTLTLIQGWNTRTISFRQGRLCYIAAGTRLPTRLDLLVRSGHITRTRVAAISHGLRNEAEVVRRLLEAGDVTPADIRRCVERQLESTIYSLFLWRNCTFTYRADELALDGGVSVDLDSEHLIIEGTRRVDEWITISPIVPSVFMIFQRRARIVPDLKDDEVAVYHRVDGGRDVVTIAQEIGRTQFDTAKVLYALVKRGIVEAAPPNKLKIIALFTQAVEAIHLKLMMFGHSREALEFQNQLNQFARDNRLKVRMSGGRVALGDHDTPIDATSLIDLYKLFIGIQNNKFSKILEPEIVTGLIEGLYRHTDPEFQSMMRMYEFVEIEGLLSVDLFENLRQSAASPVIRSVTVQPVAR